MKRKQFLENSHHASRRKRSTKRLPDNELDSSHQIPFARLLNHSGSNRLPPGAMHNAAIMQMQRQLGNASVGRYLSEQVIQRQEEKSEGGGKEGGKKKNVSDLDQWLSGELYNLVKEQLGDAKLKEYATKLSQTATDQLLTQVKGVSSVDELTNKIVVDQIGKSLANELNKAVLGLLNSPEGQNVKKAILDKAKKDPGMVVGMILVALGAMIASNSEIPELEKTLDLGKGFKAGAQVNLGKFQDISLEKLQASFSYTGKYLQASVSGGYGTEKGKGAWTGTAEAKAGTEEAKFSTVASMDKEGKLKLDFREALKLKNFNLEAGPTYESAKGWSGVLQLKIGNQYNFLTPKFVVDDKGKATVELGHTFTNDIFTLATTLQGKGAMSHKLDLLNPFGVEGLSVSATLAYDLKDPKITSASISGKLKLTEESKNKAIPVVLLEIEGKYKAAGSGKPQPPVEGQAVLGLAWKL
jgi:hypothetical protein